MDDVTLNVEEKKFLSFKVENELYGINIDYVVDINRIQEITEVPDQAHYVNGIINLRGQIIPVLDVRLRFNKPSNIYDDRTCIVVIEYDEYTVGIIVDRVEEVLTINQTDISIPRTSEHRSKFIAGITKINDRMLTIMDIERLLFD